MNNYELELKDGTKIQGKTKASTTEEFFNLEVIQGEVYSLEVSGEGKCCTWQSEECAEDRWKASVSKELSGTYEYSRAGISSLSERVSLLEENFEKLNRCTPTNKGDPLLKVFIGISAIGVVIGLIVLAQGASWI